MLGDAASSSMSGTHGQRSQSCACCTTDWMWRQPPPHIMTRSYSSAMPTKNPKLRLREVFQVDAAEIIASRVKSKIIHGTKDISASGDEVEVAVRRFLARRFPAAYHVGKGHIIDYTWIDSGEFDVVITDNNTSRNVFQAEDGTEYFPYESVYAIGEVKSAYYRKEKDISKFVGKVSKIKRNFKRAKIEVPNTNSAIYANPLFTFMFFVNSDDLNYAELDQVYTRKHISHLPNIICFLDRGVVVNARFQGNLTPAFLNITPEFNLPKEKLGERVSDNWILMPHEQISNHEWVNLCRFYYILMSHLNSCVLDKPYMTAYLSEALRPDEGAFIGPSPCFDPTDEA
jgi:hypothetical protein